MFTKTLWFLAATLASACAGHDGGSGDSTPNPGGHGANRGADAGLAPSAGGSGNAGGSSNDLPPRIFVDASAPPTPADASASCTRTASAETALEPVHLAFAFDVSGSMGKLDFPYHDPKLKWEPVVAATKGFFTDAASANMFASLVFFPIKGEDERCSADSYTSPDVPFTPLPSDAFGRAIDAITPKSSSDWRGGTPTLAVLEGTIQFVQASQKMDPGAKYSVVLVSDGYPQGCSDDEDKIETVVAAVKKVSSEISTYVIGVANPPGGPDTVTNLNDIAAAGGSGKAFLIQTGDPEKTIKDFQAAVGVIRKAQLSCDFEIPPPPSGQSFDPAKANVTYASEKSDQALAYDATCKANSSWRFDDEASPTRMVLCDATCESVRADPQAALRVEFGCTRRDVIR